MYLKTAEKYISIIQTNTRVQLTFNKTPKRNP